MTLGEQLHSKLMPRMSSPFGFERMSDVARQMRARPLNPRQALLLVSWHQWFDPLPWFERTVGSSETLKEGIDRLAAFKANASPFGGDHATLHPGSSGADVTAWQKAIGAAQSGRFDASTLSATKAWQKSKGLKADGIVGPASWAMAIQPSPTEKLGLALSATAGSYMIGALVGIGLAFLL